tara:strand:- start:167 stop:484 length:318 start_codon:yes stop_codon:yes gene_type:complete
MKITRMNKGDWGKVKAFFDLEVEGFTLKGFKVIDGVNGLFAGFPSEQKDGEYMDTVWADRELKNKVTELAIAAYGQESPVVTEEQPVVAVETAQTEAFNDEDIPF